MPRLVRLYLHSVAVGIVAAAAFTGLLLWQDVGGLGRLVTGSPDGWIAGGMLVAFNGIVFAGVQFGIRIMALARSDDDRPGRGGPAVLTPVPVPVRQVTAPRTR